MITRSVILLALVLSAPTIWQALGTQTIGVDTALVRFLVAVAVSAVLVGLVRAAMNKQPPRGR